MLRTISEYLSVSEGSDDENHGNLGETKVSEVPIGESFNDASLSKIVSYVLSYMQHDSLVFERKGSELNATGNGNRENDGLGLLIRRLADPRIVSGYNQGAFTGNNRRHSMRNARGNARDSTTAEGKKREAD